MNLISLPYIPLVILIISLRFSSIQVQVFEPIWISYNTDNGPPSSETYEIHKINLDISGFRQTMD